MRQPIRRIALFLSDLKTFIPHGSTHKQLGTVTRAVHLMVIGAVLTAMSYAQANFTVIHNFTGPDGAEPFAGPTLDSSGNLYGTTYGGGAHGLGIVYELKHVNGSWILDPLFSFLGIGQPAVGVTIGPNGTLFGAASAGVQGSLGGVFNLQPPPASCRSVLCPWNETILHIFTGEGGDGAGPFGNLVFDSQRNFYGTTAEGGVHIAGTVYEGTPSGDTWSVSTIYSFAPDSYPSGGLALDSAGNLYGTTVGGGDDNMGTVFELTPSQGGWTETVLHSFSGSDGCGPMAGLVFDRAGNLYGATANCGTIFELSPQGSGWNFQTLYTFGPQGAFGPDSTLAIDAAGVLYGTDPYPSTGIGTVFELSPTSGGGWTYTDLHDFNSCISGGCRPYGGVAVTGPGGYVYGTTEYGGTDGDGVVFQINLGALR